MRASVFSLLLVAGCVGAPDEPGVAGEEPSSPEVEPEMSVHWQRDHRPAARRGFHLNNLFDFGGPVLHASNTYAIWWGWTGEPEPLSGIESMFRGFNGTSFLGLAQQYMRGATVSTSFVKSYFDTTSPLPSGAPSTSQIVAEACNVINANHLTAHSNDIYFVYTSNFPSGVNYCAWHSYGTCNGVTIQVAYMPNTALAGAGCDPGDGCNTSTYSEGTRSLANVSSHEYMEAITDPRLNAWFDLFGSEIGDKCAWKFNGCVTLSTGLWKLQQEWSNAAAGCRQQ